mmetsp:Transcript_18634/g.24252  ORF Transcript_18634/g.24252 Transcript_18634/m.24252 type:complete len:106 (-) Transcript_18634:452-769(-)
MAASSLSSSNDHKVEMKISVVPYIMFTKGECREAMAFYQEALGGELDIMVSKKSLPSSSCVDIDRALCHTNKNVHPFNLPVFQNLQRAGKGLNLQKKCHPKMQKV